ncbi:DNA-binding protein S1FA isoform X2 [Capsicum annuum]|uniref:DNA-binding protein S1FA isoform X2 n=1 Tax=Capsicum annuum TaxID=4072 RepID=UPI001FB19AEF|nr:DNA-binding protein S1FA isoform X2 [Capsicum annuum]
MLLFSHSIFFSSLTRRYRLSPSLVVFFKTPILPSMDDNVKNMANDVEVKGLNPGLIVLIVIGGLVLTFLIGNYLLYMYAQKTLPPKKKKPVSKKKMKKERLKQGVSAPGE